MLHISDLLSCSIRALCVQIKVRELRHILTSLGEKISADEMQRLEMALNLRPEAATTTAQSDAVVPLSIPEVVEEAVDVDDNYDETMVKTDWLLRLLLVT